MPRTTNKKIGKYRVYPNGDVYIDSAFKFNLSDDREFDYIFNGGYKSDGIKNPEILLDNYPESLMYLGEQTLGSGEKEKIDLSTLIDKSLEIRTLDGKLAVIMRVETRDKFFIYSVFAESLLSILRRLEILEEKIVK